MAQSELLPSFCPNYEPSLEYREPFLRARGRVVKEAELHRSFDAGCKLIYSTQINVWEKPYVFSNVDKFFPQWLDREYNWAEETKREGLGAWGL